MAGAASTLALLLEAFGHASQEGHTRLGVAHLPASEHHGKLDLASFAEEAPHTADLCLAVMGGDPRPESHLPQEVGLLNAPRLSVFLRLKEAEPPVVHDATDRRGGRWCNLYEVQLPLPGRLEGLDCGQDAQLLSALPNDPDFTNPDLLVHPVVSRWDATLPPKLGYSFATGL